MLVADRPSHAVPVQRRTVWSNVPSLLSPSQPATTCPLNTARQYTVGPMPLPSGDHSAVEGSYCATFCAATPPIDVKLPATTSRSRIGPAPSGSQLMES
ncbi:MAG: hypothetical protein IPH48_16455 [bacterium]|nr:hypothetical protein [bacterium]